MTEPQPEPVPPKRFTPTRSTWIGLAVVAVVLLIFAASSGWLGLVIAVAMVGIFTGLYVALSGRRSWALIASRKIGLIVVLASLVILFVGAVVVPQPKATDTAKLGLAIPAHHVVPSAASTPSSKPTPTPTPTPTPVVVDDVNSQAAADARSTLVSEGLSVQLVYANGTAVTDPTGLIVVDQVPAAGSSAAPGSPVVLTLSKPVVAPAPVAPAPAAPAPAAPAPAAPAPAPAPAAPSAPAPAPAPGPLVTPGAFCLDSQNGVVGHSTSGTTYTCGGHGPDASGRLHWNTD